MITNCILYLRSVNARQWLAVSLPVCRDFSVFVRYDAHLSQICVFNWSANKVFVMADFGFITVF